jgi:His-Xaa-Ser system radical SAM maturase HxsC
MKLTTAGIAHGFEKAIVGIASLSPVPYGERSKRIWVGTSAPDDVMGYRGVITLADKADQAEIPYIDRVREIDHISEGDIVVMEPGSGFVRSLYRPADTHNSIFTTERCNSNCVMCSQPPKDKDDIAELADRNLELVRLIDPPPPFLTITGGEPTLLGDRLLTLISTLGKRMPNTALHMLTNGRKFAWGDFTADFAAVNHPDLSLGIPLYSDIASEHDFIVQAKDAFDQTIMGLHQLARRGQRIEIRVVLHAKTVERLPELAEFIYRNLTFVEHIALMGLENIGYAPRNMEVLWADSHDYQDKLHEAVLILRRRSMNVSIYNHQLCVLRPELWKYAKKSISDWKNIYIEKCEGCELKDECGGFFKWATKLHSAHIHPLRRADARP